MHARHRKDTHEAKHHAGAASGEADDEELDLLLEGHADAKEGQQSELAGRRAASVKKWLQANGVAPSRLSCHESPWRRVARLAARKSSSCELPSHTTSTRPGGDQRHAPLADRM